MQEPSSLFRLVQCARTNLLHSRCPARLIQARSIHIQASKTRTTTANTEPHRSTAIQASILERSPDRQRLVQFLKSLGSKTQWRDGRTDDSTPYFSKTRTELAIDGLSSQNPTFSVTILSHDKTAADVIAAGTLVDPTKTAKDLVNVTKGLDQDRDVDAVGVREGKELSNGSSLSTPDGNGITPFAPEVDKDRYYSVTIRSGKLPVIETDTEFLDVYQDRNDHQKPILTHQTFIVSNGSEDDSVQQSLSAAADKPLVERIHDFKINNEEISRTDSDGRQWKVSTEFLRKAFLLARETPPNSAEIEDLWTKSGILDFRNRLLQIAERKQQDDDQIAPFVRDLTAAHLATKIPGRLPDLRTYVAQDKEGKELIQEIQGTVQEGVAEISAFERTVADRSFNPFTARAGLRRLLLELEGEATAKAEDRADELYDAIKRYRRIEGPIVYTTKPVGATENTPDIVVDEPKALFESHRRSMFKMGKFCDSLLIASRWSLLSSLGAGAAGTGLLLVNGIDPYLGLVLFGIIFEVARRKYQKESSKAWSAFTDTRIECETQLFTRLRTYLQWCLYKADDQNLQEYEQKEQELEEIKKELVEARRLLLRLAPSLKSRYPEWAVTQNNED